MPSLECENGKWKFGEKGECIYNSEQESDEAKRTRKEIREVIKKIKKNRKQKI